MGRSQVRQRVSNYAVGFTGSTYLNASNNKAGFELWGSHLDSLKKLHDCRIGAIDDLEDMIGASAPSVSEPPRLN